MSSCVVTQ